MRCEHIKYRLSVGVWARTNPAAAYSESWISSRRSSRSFATFHPTHLRPSISAGCETLYFPLRGLTLFQLGLNFRSDRRFDLPQHEQRLWLQRTVKLST